MGLPDLHVASLVLHPFGPDDEGPCRMCFSSCGRWLVVGSYDGEMVVYDTTSWRERWRRGVDVSFLDLRAAADEPHVYTDLRGWDLETGRELKLPRSLLQSNLISRSGLWQADYGRDEDVVYRAGGALGLCVWSLPSGELLEQIEVGGSVQHVSLSADGRHLAITRRVRGEGGLVLMRLQDRQIVSEIGGGEHDLCQASWSPDGRWLAVLYQGQAHHVRVYARPGEALPERASEPTSEPPVRAGRGRQGLVELALQTLLPDWPRWGIRRDELLVELALVELDRGDLASARHIASHLRWGLRPAGLGELAFHCAMRPGDEHRQEAGDYLVEAMEWLPEVDPHQRDSRAHTWLAGAYHGLGRPAEAAQHLAIARAHLSRDRETDVRRLLAVAACMGEPLHRPEGLSPGWDVREVRPLVWYAELPLLLSLARVGLLSEPCLVDAVCERLARGAGLDGLDGLEVAHEGFESEAYRQAAVTVALEGAAARADPALGPALHRWLARPEALSSDGVRWLSLASRVQPELARGVLRDRDWTLADAVAWSGGAWSRWELFHALGAIAGGLGMEALVRPELDALTPDTRDAWRIGAASALDPSGCQALLEEVAPRLPPEPRLWHRLAAASARAGAPGRDAWVDEAARHLAQGAGLGELAARLASAGDFASAVRVWEQMEPYERPFHVRGMLRAAWTAQEHDQVHALLLRLDPDRLDERAERAVEVLTGRI